MTRKDYELIAATLKSLHTTRGVSEINHEYYRGMTRGISSAASALADALSDENPRFDRKRFIDACSR